MQAPQYPPQPNRGQGMSPLGKILIATLLIGSVAASGIFGYFLHGVPASVTVTQTNSTTRDNFLWATITSPTTQISSVTSTVTSPTTSTSLIILTQTISSTTSTTTSSTISSLTTQISSTTTTRTVPLATFTVTNQITTAQTYYLPARTTIMVTQTNLTFSIFHFLEDGTRKYPNGTIQKYSDGTNETWPNDPNIAVLGEISPTIWIGQMWYNYPLPDLSSSVIIRSGINGGFYANATYTSIASGLPIYEVINGTVTVHSVGNYLTGNYMQQSYVVLPFTSGNWALVLIHYPDATPMILNGMAVYWIGTTYYVAHN